jgi:hypothetical protein
MLEVTNNHSLEVTNNQMKGDDLETIAGKDRNGRQEEGESGLLSIPEQK